MSTYQYAPRFLLYSSAWNRIPMEQVPIKIAAHLSGQTLTAWNLLCRNMVGREDEHAVEAAAWLATHGPAIGCRAPNALERARAMGVADFFREAKLTARQGYDATGNMFDKDALAKRIHSAVTGWLNGRITLGTLAPQTPRAISLCLLYTSPSPRDLSTSRMPSSA